MSDLTDFLLARIAEDEAVARAALAEDWQGRPASPDNWPGLTGADRDMTQAQDDHHDAWSPWRVLAECEAKRRIVELGECMACEVEAQPCDHRNDTLRLLAVPYADHPDYDESVEHAL